MTSCVLWENRSGVTERRSFAVLQNSLEMDLTGFLFGNVNEEGELEDESLLDRVYLFKAHQYV